MGLIRGDSCGVTAPYGVDSYSARLFGNMSDRIETQTQSAEGTDRPNRPSCSFVRLEFV